MQAMQDPCRLEDAGVFGSVGPGCGASDEPIDDASEVHMELLSNASLVSFLTTGLLLSNTIRRVA